MVLMYNSSWRMLMCGINVEYFLEDVDVWY